MIIITFFGHLPIKQVFEIRYLGFYLDNNISWKKHCCVIGAKMARGLGILRRAKKTFPIKILKIIYFSLVHPYIDYGFVHWASNFFSNYKRIQILQNKNIRLIADIKEQVESKTIASFSWCNVLNDGQIRDY